MRVDGTDRRRLTTLGGQNRHPAWSPDGARIAFDHFDFHAGESDVRLVPAAGGAATTLPGTEDGGSVAPQTAWSPDGRFVAFVRLVDGTAELFTMRVDGTALRRRTTGAAGRDVAAPAWLTR
jgi:TolB protein